MMQQRRPTFRTRLSFLILAGAAAVGAEPVVGPWQPLFRGMELAVGTAESGRPRRQQVWAVRVDLRDPCIRFFATPPNGDEPGETTGERPSDFLIRHGLQVAINTAFFSPCCTNAAEGKDIKGLAIAQGRMVSGPEETPRPVLVITRENRVSIAMDGLGLDTADAWIVAPGNVLLLTNGVCLGEAGPVHPRTAAGVSRDGRWLILLAIDGRQPGMSEGATTRETAEWLARFGAWEGLNFDGGGSTTLVRSDGRGGAVVINRPIHEGVPGRERYVGSSLGIFSAPPAGEGPNRKSRRPRPPSGAEAGRAGGG